MNIHQRIKARRLELKLSMERVAEIVGVTWQTVQQWEKSTAPKRARLEAAAGALQTTVDYLLSGRLDGQSRIPLPQAGDMLLPTPPSTKALQKPIGAIAIGAVDIRASMGAGVDQPTSREVVSEMVVDEGRLRRNCTFSSPENLSLVTGVGDSMRPTFEDGDALLVDRGIRECRVDGLYCLALNDELYIKRLQRRPDGSVMMISDNRAYEPYQITQGRDRVDVLGRIVMAWNARRM